MQPKTTIGVRAGGETEMLATMADFVIDFLRPRAKILILAFFTYLALC